MNQPIHHKRVSAWIAREHPTLFDYGKFASRKKIFRVLKKCHPAIYESCFDDDASTFIANVSLKIAATRRVPEAKMPGVVVSIGAATAADASFLQTFAWRRVRMQVLQKYGARCQCCGATAKDGVKINVDHIKPRKLHPELALEPDNLQVLCEECNHGKGNWSETDWRKVRA